VNGRIDFRAVREAALRSIEWVVGHYLPGGKWEANEYVARNPTRNDRTTGSFKVNRNGFWSDFATGDKGADPIDLVAYLTGKSKVEAARELAEFLNIDGGNEGQADSRHANGNCRRDERPPQIVKGVEPPKHPCEIRRHVYRMRTGVPTKVKIIVLKPDGKKGAQQ
jgi:putative DNA primase/helicase